MKKKTFALTATVLALTSASFVAGLAVAKGAAKLPVLSPLADAKWTPLMKDPLPAFAPIEGDAMKGAHFAYLKLPAGFTSPPHSHSSDYWAVLVQGKMTHWAAEGGTRGRGEAARRRRPDVHAGQARPHLEVFPGRRLRHGDLPEGQVRLHRGRRKPRRTRRRRTRSRSREGRGEGAGEAGREVSRNPQLRSRRGRSNRIAGWPPSRRFCQTPRARSRKVLSSFGSLPICIFNWEVNSNEPI